MTYKKYDTPLINYLLHLADNALIASNRNSEWCGHGPILEQDIALTNIALDQIGQARNFYQYSAKLINESTGAQETEDSLAYLRDSWDFKNCILLELPNIDWGETILKQFLLASFQYYLYQALEKSSDAHLAAIAAKSVKEISYHIRWSADWVIRLGDGTEESKSRMNAAAKLLWPYLNEFTDFVAYELPFIQESADDLKEKWEEKIKSVFAEAGLEIPAETFHQQGGKQGIHSEHLGYILAEMQFLQRAYPGAEW